MSDPSQKKPKLIVVVAFDRAEDGELFTAYGPTDQQSEDRAVRTAKALAWQHVGVIAWSRDADPALGDYGPPTTLFVSGDVPDME
ncbi:MULTISPECIES: hypothetical protein [unclassified Mesorhizobium]|uniref:hypothetical protein n=1 Tax=unclassified Mesorhizobium TaxID=325217 RepID=UPI000FCBBF07|nr:MULTISPECIES: hypothetical protein [unclassified Mesorhizobium]RUX06692.1 hypothetical protein EOA30_09940 [Mesorhizobium sp. M8A.F.Ca.ET.059.01.1.1]TGW07258.1 hypothetical protein EN788_37770 [Mesorhizobium sp. M2D.F.Ca.ET.145.01.1.1]RUW54093.1 hypothetical protein EOA36_09485 [Mesorhizobium sp. M8A.F.Ca.ET.021.01.1.1]TGP85923.1 hypothetical protein EN861_32420 [Mesorhizobium sp. M8A.F.Ca.ET.218.01.1.1]TGT14833.1 hypothetical protein EN856_31960 [Mesorhizobium sp. M8A.F.Ca.ET.213.01.1.1]